MNTIKKRLIPFTFEKAPRICCKLELVQYSNYEHGLLLYNAVYQNRISVLLIGWKTACIYTLWLVKALNLY